MSIGGLMRTSVSGMNAQSSRLSAVSDNIANSGTTGYKKAQTEFSTLVLSSSPTFYNSGVVEAQTRTLVSEQGGLSYTSNKQSPKAVDLAVQGNGFFIVDDAQGNTVLTRAGAFRNDGDGNLVNAAGYILQGYPVNGSAATPAVLNGYAGLTNVRIDDRQLHMKATDAGVFRVNLNKAAGKVPATLAGTGTPDTKASAVQANIFDINGASDAAASTLTFSLAIDGAPAKTITVTKSTAPTGLNGMTAADIAAAINAPAGATSFGPGTASVTADGRLILTSPTTGASSSVQLGSVKIYSGTAIPANEITSVSVQGLDTVPLTSGQAAVAAVPVGTLPSLNRVDATYTSTDSIVTYDNTGKEVTFDVYMTKTGDNAWEYAIYNRENAGTGATKPFPYSQGPVTTTAVTFNAAGQMVTPAGGSINVPIPNGQVMKLDLAKTTQTDGKYQPLDVDANGNPPELVTNISIDTDGTIYANFDASGTRVALFKIPLAQVQSPDNLERVSGNAFRPGLESGILLVGFGGDSGLGLVQHGALEESTVDLAGELTTMIESQRSYTANSKVFQTGSEILDVLVNLKR